MYLKYNLSVDVYFLPTYALYIVVPSTPIFFVYVVPFETLGNFVKLPTIPSPVLFHKKLLYEAVPSLVMYQVPASVDASAAVVVCFTTLSIL